MKDVQLNLKITKEFKERVKKGADYYSVNLSQFVIQAINEKLERSDIK